MEPNDLLVRLSSMTVTRSQAQTGKLATGRTDGPDSFEHFYRREYGQVLRLAWLLTNSEAAAEDIVQDAMASVYQAFDRIDSPAAYLRKAIVNNGRSYQRSEHRHLQRLALLAGEPAAPDPGDRELLDAVGRLRYRQRVVIVTRYWGGWSEAQIAAALGCRPGTVKSIASRALQHLRREVQQ